MKKAVTTSPVFNFRNTPHNNKSQMKMILKPKHYTSSRRRITIFCFKMKLLFIKYIRMFNLQSSLYLFLENKVVFVSGVVEMLCKLYIILLIA